MAARYCSFSAYDLGERALAWIVEERALRAALVPGVHAAGVDVVAPAAFESLAFDADRGTLATRRRQRIVGAIDRRRRRRALVGARGGRPRR